MAIICAMCQSPIYRDTHFYKKIAICIGVAGLCQSPIYRDTHFYHEEIAERNPELVTCQSPIYRDTHFYASLFCLLYGKQICVNPLSIGTPISTGSQLVRKHILISVNPLSIGTPISTKGKSGRDMYTSEMCQSPIYRDTHFYDQTRDGICRRERRCVNPLSIGTPISTRRRHEFYQCARKRVSIPYLSGHPFLQLLQS